MAHARDKGLICLSAVGGTMGDVRPLIALALALRTRGFEILVFGDAAFERSAERAGIRATEWFACCQVPQTFFMRTTAGQRWLWGKRPRYRDRWMTREIARHRRERLEGFWRRVGGPNNARIVAAVGSISAFGMLGSFGPHCAKIISCPMPFQPSTSFTLNAPDLSLAGRIRAGIVERALMAQHGRRFCEDMFHLVSASPSIFPRPGDWLPNMQVTGYMPLEDDHAGWSPPAELSEFLKKGPAPVYVGFGSLFPFHGPRGERFAQEIIDGCRRRDLRCIVQSSDLPRSLGSEDVFILDGDVPHAWLFPRCATIVHHGGYGTVHAALVARRPMIIYPFQTDEFLWAARMRDLGVGPGFTARLRHLSASRLEQDLAFVLREDCQDNAERLGIAIRDEQGLTMQVAGIESIVEHTRRGLRPLEWHMPVLESARAS